MGGLLPVLQQGIELEPGHAPWLGIELATFWLLDRCSNWLSHPGQTSSRHFCPNINIYAHVFMIHEIVLCSQFGNFLLLLVCEKRPLCQQPRPAPVLLGSCTVMRRESRLRFLSGHRLPHRTALRAGLAQSKQALYPSHVFLCFFASPLLYTLLLLIFPLFLARL